ncbi:NADH-quinone oxidoreductase subunit N [Akkermansiaceae bacterium]|jgi:NADH-quinone oxidoreductase subunit N|nr:NADH-quinone oxidoreductase subunit N [Akkermansiaceae bacterium]MDB4509411.1 NADH-quinone oxidoreductase subunit N [Akkermansiaceae bacterium]
MPSYLLEIIVLVGGLVLLLLEAFTSPKKKSVIALGAIAILCVALAYLFFAEKGFGDENVELTRFYAFDPLARFFKLFTIVATILALLLAINHRKILSKFTANPGSEDGTGEYYCLFLFACAGMMWMASAKDLVSLFVSLELTTITSYILVGYMRRNVGSLEAGVKFLILGALSTGFLVYGIAWIYGATGTTDLALIGERITEENSTYLLFGLALILVSLAFKIGAVPMHLWIPDVYQGAPTPTTAFLSIASKASGFAIAIRVVEPFLNSGTDLAAKTTFILAILAGATILFGNLAAIPQKNFKRLLAYSSIANAGFILLPLAAWQIGTDELTSKQVIAFYLAIYLIMTFAAFFILAVIHRNTGSDEISAFEGLGKRHPLLAFMTAITIGALAGLPLTAGFWGKFLAFKSAVDAELWVPVSLGFIGVAAGFYYYFQIIRAMYWRSSLNESSFEIEPIALRTIVVLTALIAVLGFWPQPVYWLLRNIA